MNAPFIFTYPWAVSTLPVYRGGGDMWGLWCTLPTLREEIVHERNFSGTYFCGSATQKYCVLLNNLMWNMSSFWAFSLKIIDFFVRGIIFYIFEEKIFASKVVNHKSTFRNFFFFFFLAKIYFTIVSSLKVTPEP